jgi:Methyltransferase domain
MPIDSLTRIDAPSSVSMIRLTACELASQELLRPVLPRGNGRDLEPFSRGWFEEIEHKRYHRSNDWLPHVLEFSRHGGDTMLMAHPGLGTDALQYTRHECHVSMAVTPTDDADAIRKHFDYRGWPPNLVPVHTLLQLPFADRSFDLAYLNGLFDAELDLANTARELFRVLKPGGKLFALIPAWYDIVRLQRRLLPLTRLQPDAFTGPNLTANDVRAALVNFEPITISKRHLRRPRLPMLDRLLGRVLAVRAMKPIK